MPRYNSKLARVSCLKAMGVFCILDADAQVLLMMYMVASTIEHMWISYQGGSSGLIKKSNWRVHVYVWVNFTAVELWFSQAFAYIFNREVASKDTEQCFLFWSRSFWRTMTTALVHSLD